MDVVCTAGHVDHGKSTLVRALTGMEPDRFAEERRRGLTIDIGFGWTQLRSGNAQRTVAFVDLPGHERFIANMLAGAGPVEATLFVVAADEGWKRQSQEHLDILDLLEVSTGVVALTKTDAVDPGRVAQAEADVRGRLQGTSLADAPVVAVSAINGAGLDHLRGALVAQLEQRPAPIDRGVPRLWVDRVFTIKGAGTVVTGTLTGGTLHQGTDVMVLPGGSSARVRGLQSLKAAVAVAGPGERVAVNLVGIDRSEVRRGDVLAAAGGSQHITSTAEVWLRALHGERVAARGAWHLHLGSGEWLTQVRPADGPIAGEGFARLTFSAPAPVVAGDRFVLREAGRRATVAGGIIVDAAPPPGAMAPTAVLEQHLRAVRRDDRAALLSLHVQSRGAAPLSDAAAAVGLSATEGAAAARQHNLLPLGSAVADPTAAGRWSAAVTEALAGHHAAHPVDRTAPRIIATHAAAQAGCPQDLAGPLLEVLIRLGRVRTDGAGIRHPDHTVRLNPEQQRARAAVLSQLEQHLFSPPRLSEVAGAAGASAALVRELEAEGAVIVLAPDMAVSANALTQARQRLRAAYLNEGPLTVTRAKEILGTTRKYAVPLLELLDQRGITRRRGDLRDVP